MRRSRCSRRRVRVATLVSWALCVASCGRDGYDLVVRDRDDVEPVLTIDQPVERERVSSYRRFTGRCVEGLSVEALPGASVSAPASVACEAGRYYLPVSFSGPEGSRTLTVQQTTPAAEVKSVTRTVSLALGGVNRPVGFDEPPTLLLEDPLESDRIYAIGARLYGNVRLHGAVRLLADGTPDPSFVLPEPEGAGPLSWYFPNTSPYIVAGDVDPVSGSLYLAGNLAGMGGVATSDVVRLLPDGSLDPTFTVGSGFTHSEGGAFVGLVHYDPARQVLYVAGHFEAMDGVAARGLARLSASGAIDPSFVVTGGVSGSIASLDIDATGKLVIAGCFTAYDGIARPSLARLNTDGSLDATFDPGTGSDGTCSTRAAVDTVSDAIYVSGTFQNFNGTARKNLVRLDANGAVDPSFDAGGAAFGDATLKVSADGSLYHCSHVSGPTVALQRLTRSGALDPAFAPGEARGSPCASILVAPSVGRVFVGVTSWSYNGHVVDELLAVTMGGAVVPSYNPSSVGFDDTARVLLWDPARGKLVLGGDFTRHTHAGGTAVGHLARIFPNGTLDTTFNAAGTGLDGTPRALTFDASGRLLVAGLFNSYNGAPASRAIRLASDGGRDPSFNVPATVDSWVYAALVDDVGRIVLGTHYQPMRGESGVVRLHEDGSIDPTFNVTMAADDTWAEVTALAWDATRRELYVGGDFTQYGGHTTDGIARLREDGSLDLDFVVDGTGIFGVRTLYWEASLERLLVTDEFAGGFRVITRDGAREVGTASNGDALCYDASLRRVYLQRLGGEHPHALIVPTLAVDPEFVPGGGPFREINACAIDPASHELFMASDYRLTAYDETSLQGLARVARDGSLVP